MTAKSCHCERSELKAKPACLRSGQAIQNNKIASSQVPRNDIILKIRAHHLLCIQGFQGYGYSKEFVGNMNKVIRDLNSSRELEIISECDIICSLCPHNKKELCAKSSDSTVKIKDMDRKVLRKLGLVESEKIKFKDIVSVIKTKLKKSDIEDICANCSWKNKCLFLMSYENL